jgi:hypothetical protein
VKEVSPERLAAAAAAFSKSAIQNFDLILFNNGKIDGKINKARYV